MTDQQLATLLEEWKKVRIEVKKHSDEYSQLLKEVRTLQSSVNRIDSDLAEDRKDYGDVKIQQGELKVKVDELYDRMNRQTTTIATKVVDSVKKEVSENIANPVMEQLEGIGKEVAKKSKILYIQQKKNGIVAKIKSWLTWR